jgi:hypothetical protein
LAEIEKSAVAAGIGPGAAIAGCTDPASTNVAASNSSRVRMILVWVRDMATASVPADTADKMRTADAVHT